MLPRYATVQERCFWNLQEKLKTITQENGYNTNILDVQITRIIPDAPRDPGIIKVAQLYTTQDPLATNRMWEKTGIELHFFFDDMEGVGTIYNTVVGDIQEALKSTILDRTHPIPNQTGIFFQFIRAVPVYNRPGTHDVAGFVEYELEYFYSLNNNRLWDDVYDQQVIIEE